MKKAHFFVFLNTPNRRFENLLCVFAFGQKGSTMNNMKIFTFGGDEKARFARFVITCVVMLGLIASLVACGGGGGGGGSTTPPTCVAPQVLQNGVCVNPPPAPPSLTLASTAPDNGATGVDVTNFAAHLNFRNGGGQMDSATGTFRTTCGGADVASTTIMTLDTANSTARFAVTITGTMPFSTVCQVSTTNVQGSGPGGTSAAVSATLTFTTKAQEKIVYTDLILTYNPTDNGFPAKIMPDGTKVLAKNKTKYATVASCAPATQPQPDGTIPHSCAAPTGEGKIRYNDIFLDPMTMELKDLPEAPAGVTYVLLQDGYLRVPPDKPTWYTSAQTTNGDYVYVDRFSRHVLRMLSTTGVESVLYTGNAEKFELIVLVMVFTNR